MSSSAGPSILGGFSLCGWNMNIYVYSDESGVLDKAHNDIFVFGGLIILESSKKDEWSRRYSAVEKSIRRSSLKYGTSELKASRISNKDKGKLYRSLNNCYKFGVVVKQKELRNDIFINKKTKQRYLDYAFKIAFKRACENMINKKIILPKSVENIYLYIDEHTTATDGRYELREGLEQELKIGTFNYDYTHFFPPIFPTLKSLDLKFCNSESKLLVRASDIVANRIFYLANNKKIRYVKNEYFFVIQLP